jgi:hypothetical protein
MEEMATDYKNLSGKPEGKEQRGRLMIILK